MTTLAGDKTRTPDPSGADAGCWCCGRTGPPMLHLGNHPEVSVCINCAHFLHKEANGIEDSSKAGLGPRARDILRSVRRAVVQRGWHRSPLVGRPLKWLGRYLP